MTTEQIPLVPAEVDLRDFSFIPLEFRRLFTSETWLLAKEQEKIAALSLWCESWHQVPAASLPDNDRILAHLSQAGARWLRLKEHALRGWVKCTDGRLYHPVVAEKALEAWAKKLEQRQRTHAARVAALRKRLEHATGDEKNLLQAQLHGLLQEPVTGSKGSGSRSGSEGIENQKSNAGLAPGALTLEGGNGRAKPKPDPKQMTAAAVQVLEFLNERAKRNFQPVKANIRLIVARMEEGATIGDCKAVIANRIRKWSGDPKMEEYLRPATLFAQTNFAQYRGEVGNA